MTSRHRLLPAVSAVLLSACVGGSNQLSYRRDKAQIPSFVAILPPANQTSDGDAPDTIRRAAAEMLLGLGIVPFQSPAQDKQLYDMGLLAVGSPTPAQIKKIAAALGVDGVLMGTATQFHDLNLGVYMERVVAATLQLVNAEGDKIWEISGDGYNRAVNIDPTTIASESAKSLATNAVQRAVKGSRFDVMGQFEKALHIHLLPEAEMMTGFMSPNLPAWPESDQPGVDVAAESADGASGGASNANAAPSPAAESK
jgi:hypothetical protein